VESSSNLQNAKRLQTTQDANRELELTLQQLRLDLQSRDAALRAASDSLPSDAQIQALLDKNARLEEELTQGGTSEPLVLKSIIRDREQQIDTLRGELEASRRELREKIIGGSALLSGNGKRAPLASDRLSRSFQPAAVRPATTSLVSTPPTGGTMSPAAPNLSASTGLRLGSRPLSAVQLSMPRLRP